MAAHQFIYHMQGLTKTYTGGKKILDNVHLSFYPDAKIGVLGVNGSGKSTLLKIMAGIDKEFTGDGWVAEGARVGYLAQEPQLDPTRSVRDNVMDGVAPQKAVLDRYNDLAMNYSDETADEMTRLQDEIEAKGLWDLDSKVDQAMDSLRCPPDDADVSKLSGGERRRIALCQLLLSQPDLLLLDMGLPLMSGAQVLEQLRDDPLLAGIPCVAISANAMPADIQRALDAGCSDYIIKPYSIDRVLDWVDRLRG